MTDARYYNGPDNREFGPDADEGDCVTCGAKWNEPCRPDCLCPHCVSKRAREAAQRHAGVAEPLRALVNSMCPAPKDDAA